MSERIRGWLGSISDLELFYKTTMAAENSAKRPLFLKEREEIADAVFKKKLPQEHLEAYLQGKNILLVRPKEGSNE